MKASRKTRFVRWIAAFVSIVLFGTYLGSLSMNPLTVSAICCRKDSFDKSRYTLTGNVAQDVATIAKSQAGRTCSDFGYSGVDYGAWCDEYVADCLENAGCDDSIVAHGGTVADFEKKMRKRGAVVVSSPQPGDLLFFSWSHVEIVTRVEGGTVYCAGGNNQGKTYPGGRCAGERNAQSVANSMGGSIRLYLRPNYKGVNPNPPTTATLSKNQVWYDIKDTVTLTVSSDNATNYFLSITKDGNSVVQGIEIPGTYSISAADLGYGDYYAWASAANSSGGVDSNGITFSIVGAAAYSSVETAKSMYSLTDTVSISVSTICAKGQVIGIDKNDTTRVVTEACDSTYQISASQLGVGKYSAYFSVYNGSGGVDTERVTFYIYNPENLGTDFYAYIINTEAWKMLTNESDNNVVMHNETGYAEQIWKFTKNSDNSYKIINCKTGKALDSGGANGNLYTYDDCNNDYQSWYICGESGAYYLKPKNSDMVIDMTGGYTDDGTNAQMYDWNGTTAQKFQIWKLDYTPVLPGDLNADNTLTTADAVLLQNYLLNAATLTADQQQIADLNADGVVNALDLALLRQKLA